MKSKFWLTIASILASFTAQAAIEVNPQEHWMVKIRNTMYDVQVVEVHGNTVRIQYEDGMIGMANKEDITWLTKLSSDFI
ncbi:hypothetical protein PONTUS_196 [Vibrio phage Pontus]|uniref:Uncharacterized protein n=2 Tax=Thalassavirus TaxID=2948922 RepID=A0A7U0J577_9CAUD|nr:hypothetical protein KNU59_gp107 [Vibrio phage Pontus]YP_010114352.1 hypothetical protein KNV71_gp114 [Vibrio phage Gary]QDF14821.1 hypothetical protein PONTUS_196 [Vibrio phage Pontus]QQO89816.1 hypothetical protein GRLPWR_202 [Vibrio phage GRLPWR]QQV88286.1 hypothetical protein GARY_205 [Vibrio phage Gary]